MTHTFDIRFARSSGLAAILAAPANSFRWRGAGSLSIDSAGLEIEPKPGIHSLLARRARLRINAADLREVSRVGDDLRIEFGMPGSRRGAVPFWVRDRETAERIMRLMPTRRTIELEQQAPHEPRQKRNHAGLVIAMAILAVLGVAFVGVVRHPEAPRLAAGPTAMEPPLAATPAVVARPDVIEPTVATPVPTQRNELPRKATRVASVEPAPTFSVVAQESAVETIVDAAPTRSTAEATRTGAVVAFAVGDQLYERARQQFDAFQEHAAHFYVQYLDGQTPPEDLAASWLQFSQRVANSADFTEPKLRPMINDELAASASWRDALSAYADATRSRDPTKIAIARADLALASELTARVALHITQP